MATKAGFCRSVQILCQSQCSLITYTCQQARTNGSKAFGGFTRDRYQAARVKKMRAYAKTMLKVPLRTETQIYREMKWPLNITSTNEIFFPHAPLEKMNRAPVFSKLGRSQRWSAVKDSLSTLYSTATIRRQLKKVDPYRPIQLARTVQDMFVQANAALQAQDKQTLRRLVTENALISLKEEFGSKSFLWELVEEEERPRVLQAKVAPMTTKENIFAQVVVRLHTRQVMAVYDRAGRLFRGHPSQARSVVDYVVVERHIVNPNSAWRIAGKLMPAPSAPPTT